ncbi:MAG: DHH family phosphoesterase [Candidatus Woesearchaeota archaeon]|jgi:RecJ-like exonuclease|nr:DHH family phosphoesterase [Candidatus Woesearchaeota archaeon]MDP7458379.1 DHH family phosphoesterase [Candidatus Woesearchaeota archaeon]
MQNNNWNRFLEKVDAVASSIGELPKKVVLRLVTHLDADGLCACSIIIKALTRAKHTFSLSILPQLNESTLKELSHEDYTTYFFLDLGASQISLIEKYLPGKKVFILDHHTPELKGGGVVHLNPHLFGIDGGTQISGAGVCYLVAKALDKANRDLAHLAIIGAIGDSQEHRGFLEINKKLLQDAIDSGKMIRKKALRVYGSQSRPLYKALEMSTDLFIPGVTGSESGAIQFLHDIGIHPKKRGRWKTLSQLNEDQEKQLIASIILKRDGRDKPEDIFGQRYLLTDEEKHTLFYDAREFSTMLNACGRLDKPSVGIGICLGMAKAKKQAMEILSKYKIELMNAFEWIRKNKGNGNVMIDKDYCIVNAKDHIRSSLIGTVSSILSKSHFRDKRFVMVLGRGEDGMVKVSFRTLVKEGLDLRNILKDIIQKTGGEFGGHARAAGAIISQDKEELFVSSALTILKEKKEEKIEKNIN